MRSLSHFFLGLSILGLLGSGCEQHQFDDTKILHGDHGYHGGEHGDDAHAGAEPEAHETGKADKEGAAPKEVEKKVDEPRDVGL